MGKWNRRYIPRKNFRRYDYVDPPSSPPRFDIPESYLSAKNKVPLWEIEYCHSVRVPWRKVLASKKYIYCYPNVSEWDGSAGKEALDIAKQRYWAMINGLPCDNPLPSPDIYIDEIDWNSYVDPELMADLELHAFNSDDMLNDDRLETINEEGGSAEAQDPWEGKGTEKVKDDALGWSRWDDPINPENDNPWEQYYSQQRVDTLDQNAWRSGNGSWGWPRRDQDTSMVQEGWGQRDNNSRGWPRRDEDTSMVQEGWGQRDTNSRGWPRRDRVQEVWGQGNNNSWGWDVKGSKKMDGCGHSSGSKHVTGWKVNNSIDSCGWRKSKFDCSDSNYRDSQRFPSRGGGYRKRESSVQHTSKCKSSRFHSDSYGHSRPL